MFYSSHWRTIFRLNKCYAHIFVCQTRYIICLFVLCYRIWNTRSGRRALAYTCTYNTVYNGQVWCARRTIALVYLDYLLITTHLSFFFNIIRSKRKKEWKTQASRRHHLHVSFSCHSKNIFWQHCIFCTGDDEEDAISWSAIISFLRFSR